MGLISGKCPECGAALKINDQAKGELVCPFCGSSYLVEKAINITNVTNNVTNNVNNTIQAENVNIGSNPEEEFEKLFTLGQKEMNSSQFEAAEKHFEQAAEKKPDDWRASYYRAYCQGMHGTIGQIENQCYLMKNAFFQAVGEVKKLDAEAQPAAVAIMCGLLTSSADFHFQNAPSGSQVVTNPKINQMAVNIKAAVVDTMEKCGDLLLADPAWKNNDVVKRSAVNVYKMARKACVLNSSAKPIDAKIKALDPSYTAPSGGCYVATCVYGSYDCPEVWVLRRFRDFKLNKTWYGRTFIRTYYAISPTLVKWFGKTNWFKNMWKPKLDRMVEKYKAEGFDDTPYNDLY